MEKQKAEVLRHLYLIVRGLDLRVVDSRVADLGKYEYGSFMDDALVQKNSPKLGCSIGEAADSGRIRVS